MRETAPASERAATLVSRFWRENPNSCMPHNKISDEAQVYGCLITVIAVGIVMLVAAFLLL